MVFWRDTDVFISHDQFYQSSFIISISVVMFRNANFILCKIPGQIYIQGVIIIVFFFFYYCLFIYLFIYLLLLIIIQPVHSEGDQPWDFFGRNDAKAETPVLWPPHVKS